MHFLRFFYADNCDNSLQVFTALVLKHNKESYGQLAFCAEGDGPYHSNVYVVGERKPLQLFLAQIAGSDVLFSFVEMGVCRF